MRCSLAVWCAALAGCGDNYAVSSDAAIDASIPIDAREIVTLAMTPSTVDFGVVLQGYPSPPKTFTVENTGGQTTGALTATLTGAVEFSIASTTCTTTLGMNESCTVTVVSTPATTLGMKNARLTVSDGSNTVSSLMDCTVLVPHGFAASPSSAAFGNVSVGARSAPTVFTVTNPEYPPRGPFSLALIGTDPGEFEIGQDGCTGVTLLEGDSCTFEATFAPSSAGPQSASVVISGGSTANVALTGTGITAQLTVTPAMKDFGYLGPSGATSVFTVANVGEQASGAIALTQAGDTQFSIVSDACTGMTLAPNATCAFGVRFVPVSPGAKFAGITVAATPGGSVNVTVTGSGVAPEVVVASPATVTFSPELVGTTSSSQQITITNPFGSTTGLLSISLGGVSSADFAIANDTCTGTALAPAATCTLDVTFTPTTTGQRLASVNVSASPGGVRTVPISGTGI